MEGEACNQLHHLVRLRMCYFCYRFPCLVICPIEHVFNTLELVSHSYTTSPNNVYTSIIGELFDLTTVATTYQRIVSVVPIKTIHQAYGGTASNKIFPVQVSSVYEEDFMLSKGFQGLRAVQWGDWECQPTRNS